MTIPKMKAAIEATGARFDHRHCYRTEDGYNVQLDSQPGMEFRATGCHSIVEFHPTEKLALAEALENARMGQDPCRTPDCDMCREEAEGGAR